MPVLYEVISGEVNGRMEDSITPGYAKAFRDFSCGNYVLSIVCPSTDDKGIITRYTREALLIAQKKGFSRPEDFRHAPDISIVMPGSLEIVEFEPEMGHVAKLGVQHQPAYLN